MKEALLVIDVQKIYTNKNSELFVSDNKKVIKNINDIIEKFRRNNELIIFIKHQHKKDLSDLGRMFDFSGDNDEVQFLEGKQETEFCNQLDVQKHDIIIVKTRYDAFEKTTLQTILQKNHIDKVVICGFMTNFCCESTARTAHSKDYYVDFILDATGTPGSESLAPKETMKATASTLSAGFALIKNTADII